MTIQWLMGDALIAEIMRIRQSSGQAEFDMGMARLDQMLDTAGVAQVNTNSITRSLRDLDGPALFPMVLGRKDLATGLRILRALQFEPGTRLFITSADAIGFGYGVLVSPDGTIDYLGRVARQTRKDSGASFNPSMMPAAPSPIRSCPAFVGSKKSGLEITLSGLPEGNRLRTDFSSTLAYRGADGHLKIDSFHKLGITLSRTADGVVISPKTPEAMIRLASIASAGAVIRVSGEFDVIARLQLSGHEDQSIDAFFHSPMSPMMQWLECPPLPYALKANAQDQE
jgi:hypothetical protein